MNGETESRAYVIIHLLMGYLHLFWRRPMFNSWRVKYLKEISVAGDWVWGNRWGQPGFYNRFQRSWHWARQGKDCLLCGWNEARDSGLPETHGYSCLCFLTCFSPPYIRTLRLCPRLHLLCVPSALPEARLCSAALTWRVTTTSWTWLLWLCILFLQSPEWLLTDLFLVLLKCRL